MTYAVGVDVGTTYSAAAVWQDGRARTVALGDRAHTVPSVLFLREDGEMVVGEAATRRAVTDPTRVAREFKRRVGDTVPAMLGDQALSAERLTARMVRWVVDMVTEREGAPPDYAVLTHPANWGEYRLSVLAAAAAAAGLPDAGLVPEPVAAALYYGVRDHLEPGALVAVYDLGGGTFDATVVQKTGSGVEIVGTPDGDDQCGGIDIDDMVLGLVAAAVGPDWPAGATDAATVRALTQVRTAAVEAKEALSSDTATEVPVVLPGLTREVRITRGELEQAMRETIRHTVEVLRRACGSAGVAPADLHSVLLVGGSSRIPLVAQTVTHELGRPVAVDAHPKFAVCLGAAVAGAARLPGGPAVHAVAPHPPTRPARPDPPVTLTPQPPGLPHGAPSGPGGPPGYPPPGRASTTHPADANADAAHPRWGPPTGAASSDLAPPDLGRPATPATSGTAPPDLAPPGLAPPTAPGTAPPDLAGPGLTSPGLGPPQPFGGPEPDLAPVAVEADLAEAGLTSPADRRLPRPGRPRDPVPVTAAAAPLVVRVGGRGGAGATGAGAARRTRPSARRTAVVLATASVVGVVLALVALLVL